VTLEHVVRRPAPGTGRPPLALLLHGIGADEADLFALAPALDPRLVVVSARAPFEAEPTGYAWYAIDWFQNPPRPDVAQARESLGRLLAFVEEAREAYGADPSRVLLAGFSQGASMAVAAALARPELFCGVAAHSGRLLHALLPGAPPPALAGLPVLWQHGRHDPVVPMAFGDEARRLLPPLGVRLDFREYAIGHEIGPDSLRELAAWIGERAAGAGKA